MKKDYLNHKFDYDPIEQEKVPFYFSQVEKHELDNKIITAIVITLISVTVLAIALIEINV